MVDISQPLMNMNEGNPQRPSGDRRTVSVEVRCQIYVRELAQPSIYKSSLHCKVPMQKKFALKLHISHLVNECFHVTEITFERATAGCGQFVLCFW